MKQYNAIKGKHPGALLLFRVGDFYETFGEDAIVASKILDITLTKRSNGAASEIELAGFPHHALDSYLPRLVRAGQRVAICDQLEDPKTVKGIVKRGVTELVTPGLSMNDQVLDTRRNNYLAALFQDKTAYGVAFLDLSTGEFMVAQGPLAYIDKLLRGLEPSELLFPKPQREMVDEFDEMAPYALDEWIFTHDFGHKKLIEHFQVKNLKGFGIEELSLAVISAGAILHYLEITEHRDVAHIGHVARMEQEHYVSLDRFTIRNLELVHPNLPDGQSLYNVLDDCLTPMGHRLLRKWMVLPLKSLEQISLRLDAVEQLLADESLRVMIEEQFDQMADLERLISKVATGRINPRELNLLSKCLQLLVPLREELEDHTHHVLRKYGDQLNPCDVLIERISLTLRSDTPLSITQGNLILEGVDEQLDEYRSLVFSGKDHLSKILKRESEATGIPSLKIAFNKVFGYYLEVTHTHTEKVPEDWIRKQTLVNAERYITPELKEYEEKILRAENEMNGIEQRIYMELVAFAATYIHTMQQNAQVVAELDVLTNFARQADRYQYTRPVVNEETSIQIQQARHPVIERSLPVGTSYIPNDVYLDTDRQQIMVITGPNMAGKSALLRQTALICLMAQMGSYVPAGHARIGWIDKVFTRVGASDNLAKGESTFMVEMTETASIMNNLSNRSLVLLDEIGRGTSTYDGISIAWSLVEYLHNHPKHRAKTLFATHYHELNELAKQLERVKNYNVAVKELDNKIIFLRKLVAGSSEHSFGIHVAQLAGMPNEVVLRAHAILKQLEKDKVTAPHNNSLSQLPPPEQMTLFKSDPRTERIMDILRKTDIHSTSPIEALLKLNEILNVLKGSK